MYKSLLDTIGNTPLAEIKLHENPETYFNVDQYNNETNWKAHYHGTAKEILEQTNGQISKIVATLGTSYTG